MENLRPRTPWLAAFTAAVGCFLLALPCQLPKVFDAKPPADVVDLMTRQERPQLSAIFSVCVDENGRPESIHLVKSSGYPDYDERLFSRIQRTRFWQSGCFIESFRFIR
jgi:hypothetical protein